MDEKRMVGDYTVINSMYIGHREIILGENQKAASGERYVCCYAERVMFYEQYLEAQVSDDFAEIVKLYGERVTQAADEIMKETEKVTSEIGMNDEITAKDCKPISHDDAIEDKVIVIRGNVLRPEFRHASHQLMLCTGGFGAQKNARGRTCYCISLYSGKQTSFYRGDVLGVMDKRSLPEWAKIGLQNALEIRQNEKSHPDIFGNIQRLDNALNSFQEKLTACEAQLENTKVQLENAKLEVQKPFPQEDELKTKTARLNELNAMLNLDKRENEIVDGERAEEEPSRSSDDRER